MKKLYLLSLFALLYGKGFSQDCISLGCAKAHTGVTTSSTVGLTTATTLGPCYNGNKYEQIFWEFFYSPSGGDFTQTFTPTSGTDLALNYIIFDEGMVAPTSVNCPIDASSFSLLTCQPNDFPNQPIGPGLNIDMITTTTTANHYYAVAIINWQDFPANAASASYTFDISAPQLGGVAFNGANCPSVLPVILSNFSANVANCKVNINWAATSETNLKNYEVQASTDGTKFQSVATIPTTKSSSNKSYNYAYSNSAVGTIYYRLKITDVDGNFKYSKIVPVNLGCNGNSISVYPNPVSNILTINIANLQNDVTIGKLFDNGGKLIYSGQLKNGDNTIDMTKLSKGVYLLNLKNSTEVKNIKVIK